MSQQIIEGYQLSPQQKHVWSLYESGGHAMAYTAQCAILIEGPLDRTVLRTALRTVIERQEILRTTFKFLPEMTMPLQVINEDGVLQVDVCDLSDLCEQAQDTHLASLLRDRARLQSGLEEGNQLRFIEVRLAPRKHVLLVSLPSLYADTAALKLLMQEVGDCYAAFLQGEEPPKEPIQYADLSEWQNESLEAKGSELGIDYWRRQESEGTPLTLPFGKEMMKAAEFSPASHLSLVISRETVEALERMSVLHGSSLNTSLLASFFILLSRLNSSPGLRLGVSFDGRNYDELSSALGLFARFLPVDAELAPDLSFPRLLNALDASLAEGQRWQEFFTHRAMTPAASSNAAPGMHQSDAPPFFPFCFEFVEDGSPRIGVTDALNFTLLSFWSYISRFKVLLRCLRRGDGMLLAEWHYDAACYGEVEVARLAERWTASLDSIVAQAGEARLDKVEVIGAGEHAELLRQGRGAIEEWGGHRCVHEIFAAQAAAKPEAIAVVYEGKSLTYAELDRRANQLARYLRRRGVKTEECVGLLMGRSIEMLVGMLGIIKSGGVYVPLEVSQPPERLARMIEDAGARVVVSVEGWRAQVEALRAEVAVYLDGEAQAIGCEGVEELEQGAQEKNAAYVIYTSGSTGAPKGVCIEHRQLTNYLNAVLQRLRLPAGASFALVSTFAADLGNTVIFPALCTGGTLHIISTERTTDADALAEYFREQPVDCLKIVPSHLSALMTHSRPELVLPRKCLVLGGEASSWELIERVQRLVPDCRILNHYGPTETTVGVLTYAVEKGAKDCRSKTVPLGYPIANTQVYVLDALLRPSPLGVPGEVHIGGANVARGYLNNPETAAAKFIPNPFGREPGERLYKTGDLARHLPDGSIEFLGRTDDQVKVRGFRIEPGEIEEVISRHQGIERVKVLARETAAGDKRLVAYLVPEERHAGTVRQWLRLEREGGLNSRQGFALPNGMLVASQNKNETDFMYKEIFEQKIYLQHGVELKDGDCVFDVGANIGMFSLFVGRMCRHAKIYAFEPIPPLYELLRANAALYGLDANLFKCGVSAETTRQEFTYYPHLTLMSGRFADLTQDQEVVKLFESNRWGTERPSAWDERILDEVLAERMTSESFVCQMKRISDVIREHRIERIDLLKIDVQKSELEVLKGIDEGDWSKIEQVVLEVHDVDDRLRQIVSLLEAQGFQVAVQQEAMLKETGLFDVYCVRPRRGRSLPGRGDEREASASLPEWTSPDSLIDDVRAYLKEHLPEHMIPSAFVLLESMPLTLNGKIDRQALPEPVEAGSEAEKRFAAPSNETERLLADIWQQVLGRPRVGISDNFFELGGDSILSIQIVARANQAGLRLSPKLLFRHQTIAELSAAINEASANNGGAPLVEAEQGLLTGPVPLLPIQRYFFEQSLPGRNHFNLSLMLNVHRPLRADHLQRVVNALVEHHDALRLRFEQTEQGWQQRYGGQEAVDEVSVQVVDVTEASAEQQLQQIETVSDAAQRSMSLDSGGLLRVVLFETGAEQRLLLAAHHLIVDGVSWRVLVEDLAQGLEQVERAEAIEFGKKTTSYRRWAERLEKYARGTEAAGECDYWLRVEKSRGWKLPVDYPDGRNSVESARTVSASLDTEETRALLQEVPEAYRTQINDVLLTAVAEAVGKWSGRRQLLVEMEGHGREELGEGLDISRTVGWCTTLFPVLLEMGTTAQGGALLKSVKEQLRRVPQRGIVYGLLRYLSEDEEMSRRLRALPQPELKFNYFGQLDNVLSSNSLFSLSQEAQGAERDGRQSRAHLLDINGAISGGRLRLNLIYSQNVHRRATVEGLSRSLMEALRAIIAHCQSLETGDLSPSDFPLAKLSQQQLDLIMARAAQVNQPTES
jgi:amino acid adenylation domain-containing protein/non-ribosomal peptide synthase protein (TIGR01720 family)/FkbM family methyltransferase